MTSPTLLLAWTAGTAAAFERRAAEVGETIEQIAGDLGDPALADEIRRINRLGPDAQPAVGQVLVLPPPAGPHADQQAFLFSVHGDVTATDDQGTFEPAAAFRSLPVGAIVCTGAESYAALRMASTCVPPGDQVDDVVLDEDTCVVLESAFASTFGRSTMIRITRGSVTVAPGEDPGRITVRTDSGLTVGRDGGFRVHAEPAAMRAEALTGAVRVQGATRSLSLDPRTGSRVPFAGDPEPAVDLLPPAALVSPAVGVALLRPQFVWTSVDGAFAYRLEIANNRAFTAVVFAETVEGSPLVPPLLLLPTGAPDRWWWRVAATDRFGYLGVPTDPRPFSVPPEPGETAQATP